MYPSCRGCRACFGRNNGTRPDVPSLLHLAIRSCAPSDRPEFHALASLFSPSLVSFIRCNCNTCTRNRHYWARFVKNIYIRGHKKKKKEKRRERDFFDPFLEEDVFFPFSRPKIFNFSPSLQQAGVSSSSSSCQPFPPSRLKNRQRSLWSCIPLARDLKRNSAGRCSVTPATS